MNYIEFTESYIANNFGSANAGMDFTNLVIAIPIIATVLLLFSNFIRTKFAKYIPNGLFECKFISITLICYVLILVVTTNLFNYQLSVNAIFMVLIGYAIFLSLSWCICREYYFTHTDTQINADTTIQYEKEFLRKIKQKIENIKISKNAKNILINGSWGAGKSYFIKNNLTKTTPSIYMSCTDYADTHELISALIEKTNNCIFRWLVRLSISRLLAILGKFELKQFIGINKVIVFDEFERLVDYNKIDPMHIVSLIQYLNNQKNCICLLVANEDLLNSANQFYNVREKLISAIYHYKLPFDDVLKIIKDNNKEMNIDLKQQQFSQIYQSLRKWYQIDNNIRMIEHLYIKINQLYHAYLDNIKTDNFLQRYIQEDESQNYKLFIDLFSYVEIVIIQLYYLYLKNPYYLQLIGQFAEIYHKDSLLDKSGFGQIDQQNIQQLSEHLYTLYAKQASYYSDNYILPCLNKIQENAIFVNIDQRLITGFISNNDFIRKFLEVEEIDPRENWRNVQYFMQKFKEIFCESEDSDLVISYFKTINIFEARYLDVADKHNEDNTELFYIIYDYLHYQLDEIQPKAIRINSESNQSYINALTIYILLQNKFKKQTLTNIEALISSIRSCYGYNNKLINNLFSTDTLWTLKFENVILPFINLLSKTATDIICKFNTIKTHEDMLEFLYTNYSIFLFGAGHINNIFEIIHECNKKMISLLDSSNQSVNKLFDYLKKFNDSDDLIRNFELHTSSILVEKIKEIFDTPALQQEFINTYKNHAWDIPKQVAQKLQEELTKSSSDTQENPDDTQQSPQRSEYVLRS